MIGDPSRDDEVAAWLKRYRDKFPQVDPAWGALDFVLDDYRLHADTGTPLNEEAHDWPGYVESSGVARISTVPVDWSGEPERIND